MELQYSPFHYGTSIEYNTIKFLKAKKYKKTSRATSKVGYQTNVVFESASISALEFLAHDLFIYFVLIKYFIRAYDDKVNCASFVL